MTELPYKIPESKEEVLAMIQSYRKEFSSRWKGLSEEEMQTIPGPQSDWSVKDLIAHMTWWEGYMISRIVYLKAGESLHPLDDYDAVNTIVYEVHKDLSLAQVLIDFEQSLPRVLAVIESLTWDEINGGLDYMGKSLLPLIEGDTFGHYLEHQVDLVQFVGGLK